MANPNLLSLSSVTGQHTSLELTTSEQTLLNNAASSGQLWIVDLITISNIDGVNAADVTLTRYSQDDRGGTGVKLANTISVPADSAVQIRGPFHLTEDKSWGAVAGANSDLTIHVDYKVLS